MPPQWWDTTSVFSSGVPFAVDANGHWRDVGEVARGKACNCFCAECHGQLVARQGEVRVHHFAHADRKECKEALEGSLFGMAIEILREPGAKLRLPGPYDVSSVACLTGAEPYQVSRAVMALNLAPMQSTLVLARPVAAVYRMRDAKVDTPDISAPDQSFALHLLSSAKALHTLERQTQNTGDVLALNPLRFARWWYDSVCDPDIEENLREASRARDQFRHWLAESVEGRGWIKNHEELRVADLVKRHVETERSTFKPRPSPQLVRSRPLQAAQPVATKPPLPDKPDQVLQQDAGKCPACNSPMDIILKGAGLFAGKRLQVCRTNPKHPMMHLGSG